MPTALHRILIVAPCAAVVLMSCSQGSAQVSEKAPQQSIRSTTIGIASRTVMGISRLELPDNRPDQIRTELLDTNTLRLIARSGGLTEADLKTLVIVPYPGNNRFIELHQTGNPERAFIFMGERLEAYRQARLEGHTKACLFAALTNTAPLSLISDPDLQILAAKLPMLPTAWFKKSASGMHTNSTGGIKSIATTYSVVNGRQTTSVVTNHADKGEVSRWANYTITDGDIAWVYSLMFDANGKLNSISGSRKDAKDNDPKFQRIIKDVEDEVDAEMKRNGTFGKFGSIREFWHLKKVKLKTKGIEWRSPAELNPNAVFD